MPRVRELGIPQECKEICEEIRNRYGDYMTAVDVGRAVGFKHAKSYKAWLIGVPGYDRNGRTVYRAMDVAKKIYAGRIIA